MPNGKTPKLCIRFKYRARIFFECGFWRVSPVGVWAYMTRDEKEALKAAHTHAQRLNATPEAHAMRKRKAV